MAILKIPTDTSQATLGYLLADGTIPLTGDWDVGAFDIKHEDNKGVVLGTGDDAKISYDGADLILDPDVVGSGSVVIPVASATAEAIGVKIDGNTNSHILIRDDGIYFGPTSADFAPVVGIGWSSGDILKVGDLGIVDLESLWCKVLYSSTITTGPTPTDPLTLSNAVLFQNRVEDPSSPADGWFWVHGTEGFKAFFGSTTFRLAYRDDTTLAVTNLNSGLAFDFQNTTAAAGEDQVGILRSGNKTAGAAGDGGYISLYSDDDAENQQEFARQTWEVIDAATASKDARISLDAMIANSPTEVFSIGSGTMRLIDNEIQDSAGAAQITIATSGNEVTVENDLRVDGRLGVNATPGVGVRAVITGMPDVATSQLLNLNASVDLAAARTTMSVLGVSGSVDINDNALTNFYGLNFAPSLENSLPLFSGATVSEFAPVRLLMNYVTSSIGIATTITNADNMLIESPVYIGEAADITIDLITGVRIKNLGSSSRTTVGVALDIEAQSGSGTDRSIRVLGSAVSIHQPAMTIGGTGAPTSGFNLDVQGDAIADSRDINRYGYSV